MFSYICVCAHTCVRVHALALAHIMKHCDVRKQLEAILFSLYVGPGEQTTATGFAQPAFLSAEPPPNPPFFHLMSLPNNHFFCYLPHLLYFLGEMNDHWYFCHRKQEAKKFSSSTSSTTHAWHWVHQSSSTTHAWHWVHQPVYVERVTVD